MKREYLDESHSNVVAGGTAADRAERLTRTMRDQSFPNVKPRDSATLILIDRAEAVPKVLLGRRHQRHRFMPGKFVFPGGRIEPADRLMAAAAALHERHVANLMQRVKRPSAAKAAAFALAAVRETYEETGLMLGVPAAAPMKVPPGHWEAFAKAGIVPDLSADPFRRPRHHAAEAAVALRQPLLHRRRFRDRAARRRLCRTGQGTRRTGLAADYRGAAARYAGHHRGRARRAAGPHRRPA